jgi:hypothetical protein
MMIKSIFTGNDESPIPLPWINQENSAQIKHMEPCMEQEDKKEEVGPQPGNLIQNEQQVTIQLTKQPRRPPTNRSEHCL